MKDFSEQLKKGPSIQRYKETKHILRNPFKKERQKHNNNVTEVMHNTNATPFRSHTDSGYTCCFCTNAFLDPADLKQHTIEEHVNKHTVHCLPWLGRSNDPIKLDITSLYCNLCGDDISTIEQITEHLQIAHNREVYTDIKNQILPFKFDTKMFTCCICSAEFHNYKPLLEHMNTHYRNFICEICDSGYVNSRMLKTHSRTHKTGTFVCDYCPKEFNTIDKKRMHERGVHTKTSMFKCGYCGEQFRYIQYKERHLRKVHGIVRSEFRCEPCDKTYSSQKQLLSHTKRFHLMERPHHCEYCDMGFFSTGELKFHLLKHTGVRDFKCDVCHKSYSRKYTLREHMRIHEDDRRYECEHCKHTFVQKCSWKGHMRSKHGEEV